MSNDLQSKFVNSPSTSWLGDLDAQERTTLCSLGDFVELRSGDILIQQGEQQPFLYMVISGDLKVTVGADGKTTDVASLKEGNSIGEMSMVDQDAASATVTAVSDCQLWRMKHDNLLECWMEHPRIVAVVILSLFAIAVRRIKEMNPQLAALKNKQATDPNMGSKLDEQRRKRIEIARRIMESKFGSGVA
ncbi:MAG: cyclic nucleotide-binding domain-containing protein [Verrucomicrobiota bacterium]